VSPPENSNDEAPKAAGRVRHDSTGRAIWEWAADSGRHALESTSLLLKRLDLPGLSLADDDKKKEEAAAEKAAEEDSGRPAGAGQIPQKSGNPGDKDPAAHSRRSFNPYDTRTPAVRGAPKPIPKPVARVTQPPRKRGFLARLFGKQ
jgi:hypothetical protein